MPLPRPTPLALLCAAALLCSPDAIAGAQPTHSRRHPVAHTAGGCGPAHMVPTRRNIVFFAHITFCLINGQREHHGLRPLREDAALDHSAQNHSASMVVHQYFSHNSADGASPFARIGSFGYRHACALGENIAAGTGSAGTPWAMVQAWMHSPEHRANILDGAYRDAGIGVAYGYPGMRGARGATFTQDFGRHC